MASARRKCGSYFFFFTFLLGNVHVRCIFLSRESSPKRNSTSDVLSLNLAPCDFSNPDRITVGYEKEPGLLSVTLKQFPSVCNVSKVGVQLSTNTCNSIFYNIHTPRRMFVFKPEGAKGNPCNRNLVIRNEEITFTLRHIHSGLYCLRVFVIRHGSEDYKEIHKRELKFMNEEPVVYPFEWNTTLHVIHKSPKELAIRFATPDANYQFSQFLVALLRINGTCPTSDSEWDNVAIRQSSCLKPNVSNKLNLVESKFADLPDGNYCVLITPMDERCHPDATYWKKSSDSSCTRYYPRTIVIDHIPTPQITIVKNTTVVFTPEWKNAEDSLIIGVGSFFTTSALIAAFVLLRRIKSVKPFCGQRDGTSISGESASQTRITRPELLKASVVLFYGVRDQNICRKVQQLKQVLTSIGFCQVYDYRDDALYDLLATHGPMWISALLAKPEIKVVVVTSVEAVEAQQELLRIGTVGGAMAEAEDPLGQMYLQGLRDLMILGQREGGYQRIFCVRFPEFTGSELALSFVTPFVCFLLPEHTQQLLNQIHSLPGSELTTDSCWDSNCNQWDKLT